MIGTQTIQVTPLPKLGDRDDFKVRAVGPGETDYTFPLSITGTASAIWGTAPLESAEYLAQQMLDVTGTAKAPPQEGFWFDSYNSGNSLKSTADKFRNEGIARFTKGEAENEYVRFLGKELFQKKEEINQFFANKYGFEFFRSFDDAFEDSQAIDDLNVPPKDNAQFLYRVCILSGFIDHINVRITGEKTDTPTLQALKNWLKDKLTEAESDRLTETFKMIKYLRKQYPIHEHYKLDANGVKTEREEIKAARSYFGLASDFEGNWVKVSDAFKKALSEIELALQ